MKIAIRILLISRWISAFAALALPIATAVLAWNSSIIVLNHKNIWLTKSVPSLSLWSLIIAFIYVAVTVAFWVLSAKGTKNYPDLDEDYSTTNKSLSREKQASYNEKMKRETQITGGGYIAGYTILYVLILASTVFQYYFVNRQATDFPVGLASVVVLGINAFLIFISFTQFSRVMRATISVIAYAA